MGRKYKHLYDDVCTFENLWIASRKARKGKRTKAGTVDFEYHLEENLLNIQEMLLSESYEFGKYRTFTIHEPKEREIASAPYKDRVVHHALCNIIEPILDKAMIHDSYACRVGKGSHRALDRAHQYLKRYQYTLKFDFRKYFFTIDHEILLNSLSGKITDGKVLALISKILGTYSSGQDYYYHQDGDDLFDVLRPRGLPIGNLTSQLFANFYLNSLDRFVKETLKIRAYIRYMDDGIIFSNSKIDLTDIRKSIIAFAKNLRLTLHKEKTQISPVKNGLRFLGFHLYPTHRRILRENLQRFKKKFRRRCELYSNTDLAFENLLMSLNAWLGYVGKNHHIGLIDELLGKIKFQHPGKEDKYTFQVIL